MNVDRRIKVENMKLLLLFFLQERSFIGGGSSILGRCLPMTASTLLSSSRFLLARMWVPTLVLMNLSARLSLENFEQLHGAPLVGRKAAHLPDHVRQELGVLGEAHAAPAGRVSC